ncbi:MAG: Fic family protein [Zoogloeaceae bacterium]|nr:Fic family protein [Zoogloeaceae bacterium]
MADPYVYPGTYVLKNKFDLRDEEALREAEYRATARRAAELERKPIKGNFDMKHLQAYHKHLFQDVYQWAGKSRTIGISKGDTFAAVEYLDSFMKDIHKRLEKDNFLRGLEKKEFVSKFTEVYGDINALHPFREGNGRSTREFMKQLAYEAGYKLDIDIISRDRNRWNEASHLSFHGRMEELRAIFAAAISLLQA